MKKLLVLVLCFFVLQGIFAETSPSNSEQEKNENSHSFFDGSYYNSQKSKHVIKGNITAPVFSLLLSNYLHISLALERVISKKDSLSIGANLGSNFNSLFLAGANLTWRHYFNLDGDKHTPTGWYAGVPLDIYYTNTTVLGESAPALSIALGGTTGYQWILSQGLALDTFVSPQVHLTSSLSSPGFTSINIFSEFIPIAGINIGYAF